MISIHNHTNIIGDNTVIFIINKTIKYQRQQYEQQPAGGNQVILVELINILNSLEEVAKDMEGPVANYGTTGSHGRSARVDQWTKIDISLVLRGKEMCRTCSK